MSIDRPSLQFAMSVVMSGMSEPKVVHQLQVVRVARYVLQHPGETWLFGYQADPKTLYDCMCTQTRIGQQTSRPGNLYRALWRGLAVTCLTAASRSNCLPERRHCHGRGGHRSKPHEILEQIGMQSEVTIASDSGAARGICTRTGSGKVRHLSIKELWIQDRIARKSSSWCRSTRC